MQILLPTVFSACARWVGTTFIGRNATSFRADVPGFIARWMFRVGTLGAAIQLPITGIVLIFTLVAIIGGLTHLGPSKPSKELLVGPYLLINYAVWAGWGWRSRRLRSKTVSILFWLGSAAFYAAHPVQVWMESGSLVVLFQELWDPFSPALVWFLTMTGLSLIALVLEIFRPKQVPQPAEKLAT